VVSHTRTTYKLGVDIVTPDTDLAAFADLNQDNAKTIADKLEAHDTSLAAKADTSALTTHAALTTTAHGGIVPSTRTITTTAPLTGGGDLSANRTLAITAASQAAAGSMSAADKTALDHRTPNDAAGYIVVRGDSGEIAVSSIDVGAAVTAGSVTAAAITADDITCNAALNVVTSIQLQAGSGAMCYAPFTFTDDVSTPLLTVDTFNGAIVVQNLVTAGDIVGGTYYGDGANITGITATQVGAVPSAWVSVGRVQTSNVTTTATSAADITGMSFPIAFGEHWQIEATILCGCNNTGGLKVGINVPASNTFRVGVNGNGSATTFLTEHLSGDDTLSTNAFNVTNSQNGVVRLSGIIHGVGVAGTVQLRFASATSGQTSTVYVDSILRATRIS
jgi:hypothetical protein